MVVGRGHGPAPDSSDAERLLRPAAMNETALTVAPGGQECALFEDLSRHPGVEVPRDGFGSSDCASCPAHLLRIGRHFDPRVVARAVELVWVDRGERSEAGRCRTG